MTFFTLLRLLVFILLSLGILRLSWRSLLDPRSYRFYRFIAFELLLAMVLVNLPVWFRAPFSAAQIISWLLLVCSAFLALHGFSLLRAMGQPIEELEGSSRLVQGGAYRYIRHPLYASLLYFTWGVFFKSTSLLNATMAAGVSFALFLTALNEERENLSKFGRDYEAMMARTKRFIPFIF
jgi:protein-S-isoprenylcysteine O-methyltransferase Ste14